MIIGGPGSGKSTLARAIGERIGLPVTHIDQFQFQEGWVEVDPAERDTKIRDVIARPSWIIDGNYSSTIEDRMGRADMLIWLGMQLDSAKGVPVIVILHHPPIKPRISMDEWVLRTPTALIDRLVAHGDVRQVISGHIHMTTTTCHRGIAFTTIAGGCTTSTEDFGRRENKFRRTGPAQMAVVLSDAMQTTVHFDNYVDANPVFSK